MRATSAACWVWCAALAYAPAAGKTVNTTAGPVVGTESSEEGVNVWYTIPYGASPERFRPPVAPATWSEPLDATTVPDMSHTCAQWDMGQGRFEGTEDCLNLNVFAPKDATNAPVLFWIHGGSWLFGDSYGSSGGYDGSQLAAKHGVVVVSINYRLDVFGGLALPELRDLNQGGFGNFWLLDQQMALRWAKANVQGFGGDPDRITIWGESAGSFSVGTHLVAPASKGLFQAAAMESGALDADFLFFEPEAALRWGETYALSLGCANDTDTRLDCLMALNTSEVMRPTQLWVSKAPSYPFPKGVTPPPGSVQPAMAGVAAGSFGPVMDGATLPVTSPLEAVKAGHWANVPVLIGTNNNEGTLFVPDIPTAIANTSWPTSDEDFETCVTYFFGPEKADDIVKLYPSDAFRTPRDRMAKMLTDVVFECPTRRAAAAITAAGQDVFAYRFEHDLGGAEADYMGEYHSSEVAFVFDHPAGAGGKGPLHQKRNAKMATQMSTFWTAFSAAHEPGQGWAPFGDSGSYLVLKEPGLSLETGYGDQPAQNCDFWDATPANCVTKQSCAENGKAPPMRALA